MFLIYMYIFYIGESEWCVWMCVIGWLLLARVSEFFRHKFLVNFFEMLLVNKKSESESELLS